MAEREEGRKGRGPVGATLKLGREELEALRCVIAPPPQALHGYLRHWRHSGSSQDGRK